MISNLVEIFERGKFWQVLEVRPTGPKILPVDIRYFLGREINPILLRTGMSKDDAELFAKKAEEFPRSGRIEIRRII